ncbi:MAG: SIS domain-containing protein, partial [Spirochaetaceae bacterium]|nr:SIS domain-containing protein [Spirochaetaceae bacterium]
LYMVGLLTTQPSLLDEIRQMADFGPSYMTRFSDQIKKIAEKGWNHAVVLADGVVEGIAEEGALAFKEICQLPSNYYNLLDSRHGPSVLFNEKTLILFFLSNPEDDLQKNLVEDYLKKGSITVVTGERMESPDVDLCIPLPKVKHREVLGIPFIFIPQLLSLEKALKLGVDPDNPADLSPWIKL